ncbi:MAG TPA: DNA-directed RNA polymerase subunit beta [Candidatus Deferrimicrobiaceae bacterium]|jgi:DNA-directed RNA polymerase subunit beta|nr:DNA-directed RNA polymerase subunit beta [Candidatus Deferrimicrobiaceae bacterium]
MMYLDYRNLIKRVDFSKIGKVIEIPNLIKAQQQSYDDFLQADVPPEKRKEIGLRAVFKSIFPITDYNGRATLEFVSYAIGQPKWNEEECRERGMNYASPIKVTVQLVIFDVDETTAARTIRDVKEQEVFFGEIPLMTARATFIINGTERVIVSQLHRSPGVFFEHDKGRSHASGKVLFSARIIPYRGSWLDFEFDHKDMLYVKIDRKRKFPIAVLLRAIGMSTEELLRRFYEVEEVTIEGDRYTKVFRPELMVGLKMPVEIRHPKTNEVAFKKGIKVSKKRAERFADVPFGKIALPLDDLLQKVSVTDIGNAETGEVILECGQKVTEETLALIREKGITSFSVFSLENADRAIWEGLMTDKIKERDEALKEIYKKMRPGDPPTKDAAVSLFENLFFNPERYSLSKVGRLKMNHKLGIADNDLDSTVLRYEDILRVIRYLIHLKNGIGEADDIDNLGNRRVRTVGELIENQFRMGLVRVERAIREKMSLQDIETLMPHDLINAKPVSAVVKEFFGSSQLSQFMDQTNPLSEVTHKRRVSALGPGGLTRERAGFEVRDVHPTHYGRICPIETPEGPNIGLIASLSTFARINEFGFIETPYRAVRDSRVTSEIVSLSAMDEEKHVIAQANAPIDGDGRFEREVVIARKEGEFAMVRSSEVTLMDVSPNQLVSVAASLIPFLEHDDANRALMGSNMQRQAVPLLRTEPPLVGTGMESVVARDSGAAVEAVRGGKVESVDARRIVIRPDEPDASGRYGADIYNLVKFRRSNQNTCVNQKPIVTLGQKVKTEEVIADGPATSVGELSLGRNVLVAFMPWRGYNFEDSILISETIVKEDIFTSIHIEEFECVARETKLGKEEITADIPNISEESLKDLDESGIVRIGARVKPMDILVGKVTPKGETQLSPEEKLLRAIFGDKAGDVKDSSLRVPPGIEGIVIDSKVFTRKGGEKDDRSQAYEEKETERLLRDQDDEIRIIMETAYGKMRNLLLNKTSAVRLTGGDRSEVILNRKKKLTEDVLDEIPKDLWAQIAFEEDPTSQERLTDISQVAQDQVSLVKAVFEEKIGRMRKGDELPPGVLKMVKVYIAMKRKLSVGDKMAGRHGNKGVISRIVPEEDMPYLSDGTPVDIVLNPLGVPSRMNVGQIMETHLGWASRELGEKVRQLVENEFSPRAVKDWLRKIYDSKRFEEHLESLDDEEVRKVAALLSGGVFMASPVFSGANEEEIRRYLGMAGLPETGQTSLYDGMTGELFHQQVTVGSMYMMKLHHLVDDKIHARSTGPYSLVTQQPLGGKAQFGGQRLGEMEVWALEAYGAAYTLQEFLTVKSDDVPGRARMYEAIVKGNFSLEPGLPESFNVLIKELQALGLDVELISEEAK